MAKVNVLSLNPAGVNCSIVTGSRRSLIVDAGPGPNTARVLAHRAAALSEEANGRPNPIDVVTTHDHWDHFFGNASLVAEGAETFYASTSFAADQEATAWIALDAIRSAPETSEFARELPEDPGDLLVEVTPVEEAELDLGDCPVEFHVLGGHSTVDVVIRLPDLGVVFTGDLVEEGDPPQAGSDAALGEWVRSLQTLLAFDEATVFVPGHGVPVDRDFVARQCADLEGYRTMSSDAEVALPARSMPGEHDRTFPRECALRLP
ncbi:MBL fold metallo-hydrolase [Brevibacterium sp.]|uniref:MBL fold metallo-hydrolase n=1 Tax=Brevibacterium sp. TaxID=1701 RepID=UPI00281278E0|nr:MBL fold metallo-hydrolase [Brevibacterium sp.]